MSTMRSARAAGRHGMPGLRVRLQPGLGDIIPSMKLARGRAASTRGRRTASLARREGVGHAGASPKEIRAWRSFQRHEGAFAVAGGVTPRTPLADDPAGPHAGALPLVAG